MSLFNQKLYRERIARFDFPTGEKAAQIEKIISNWQHAIRDRDLSKTKEKSVQGLFLIKFFEEILGYASQVSSKDEWSLIQHPQSEVDAQEPDGSLGFFTKAEKITKAVIELKDAKTLLDKKQTGREKGYTPIEQAYLYATKFDRCNWIIVSNFREIRLYHKNRTQDFFEKFDVLELHKPEEFRHFYYLLCKQNLIPNYRTSVIDDLFSGSTKEDEDITFKFYQDYKNARLNLYHDLVAQNPAVEKPLLLEKAQKIIDRFIFILFCEDTGNLLPRNLVKNTYDLGIRSRERSDQRVWREFKNLFMDIDMGRSDIDPEINKYNGGLFAQDNDLDNLVIKDTSWQRLVNLNKYNFVSELNVNILGHIFEQSISDIENFKAELWGKLAGNDISKRRKEGIFYTPEFITKYLVESVVGRFLAEHPEKLETIKILDPACGSGAFLNQAHSYLTNEYNIRFEQNLLEKAGAGKQQLDFSNINLAVSNRSILLNNLFGVDLNQESVEITKLSLWLKTAHKSEPLQNLDKNIRYGNSLISSIALDSKAFNWQEEFKEILDSGGFDIIIGNPPYISSMQLTKMVGEDVKKYWKQNYISAIGTYDIYILFFEQALKLLREGGYLGFITPNKFLSAPYGEGIRNFIKENCEIVEVFDLSEVRVFDEPSVYPILTILKKSHNQQYQIASKVSKDITLIDPKTTISSSEILDSLPNSMFSLIISKHPELVEKIFKASGSLESFSEVNATSTAGEADDFSKHINEVDVRGKKLVNTGTIDRYVSLWGIYELQNKGKKYLRPYLDIEKFSLSPHRQTIYNSPKIIIAKVAHKIEAFLDVKGEFASLNTNCIYDLRPDVQIEFLLGIINSKFMSFIYAECFGALKMSGGYLQFQAPQLRVLPIILGTSEQQGAIAMNVRTLTELYSKLYSEREYAVETLKAQYKKLHVTEKLKTMDNLGLNEFIEELEKQKITPSLEQKGELGKWLRSKRDAANLLIALIDKLERDIDMLVYELYNLNDTEIQLIEIANQS